MTECDRARLVVENRTKQLPFFTLVKSGLFLGCVIGGWLAIGITALVISFAVLVAQVVHMILVFVAAYSFCFKRNFLRAVTYRVVLSLVPLFFIISKG